jgi:hypothetical protein
MESEKDHDTGGPPSTMRDLVKKMGKLIIIEIISLFQATVKMEA